MLEVAKENAQKAGVADRYNTIEGSAFDVEFGSGYDLVLLTNFLHHFDPPTCETLLRKVHAALADGGRAVTLEFVPNEDRVTPPDAAGFSMMMLTGTPSGDAYTFAELERMVANAGFSRSTLHPLPPTINRLSFRRNNRAALLLVAACLCRCFCRQTQQLTNNRRRLKLSTCSNRRTSSTVSRPASRQLGRARSRREDRSGWTSSTASTRRGRER